MRIHNVKDPALVRRTAMGVPMTWGHGTRLSRGRSKENETMPNCCTLATRPGMAICPGLWYARLLVCQRLACAVDPTRLPLPRAPYPRLVFHLVSLA